MKPIDPAWPRIIVGFEVSTMKTRSIRAAFVTSLALGLAVVVSSCSHRNGKSSNSQAEVTYKRRSGDLAAFFIKEACAYGARPKTNAVISKVETSWEFAPDADGFQIQMLPSDTERLVKAALVPAFGEPQRRSEYPHIYYYINDTGISLTINTDEASNLKCWGTKNHHLICVRGSTMLKQLGAKQ